MSGSNIQDGSRVEFSVNGRHPLSIDGRFQLPPPAYYQPQQGWQQSHHQGNSPSHALGDKPLQQQLLSSLQHTASAYTNAEPSQGHLPSAPYGTSLFSAPSPPETFLLDNASMLKSQGHLDDHEDENEDVDEGADDDQSRGSGKRSRVRRPHLQGRFSGRLTTKEDERRLAEECKLLGPLLGGVGKRGDKSRLTLAKIVRGIASGDIRRFCEEREAALQVLKQKLAAIDPDAAASVPIMAIQVPGGGGGSLQMELMQRDMAAVQRESSVLRQELQARERLLLELQDKGIISGFVPTSLPIKSDDTGPPPMLMPSNSSGRSIFMDMPTGTFIAPNTQPQSSVGRLASLGMDLPAMPSALQAAAAAVVAAEGGAMPAASEHSRASRPLKRPAMEPPPARPRPQLSGAGPTRSGSYGAPGSLTLQVSGSGLPQQHTDLQQQLSTLQAQVEQLQNIQQGRIPSRSSDKQHNDNSFGLSLGGQGGMQQFTQRGSGSSASHGAHQDLARMMQRAAAGGGNMLQLGASPFFSEHTVGGSGGGGSGGELVGHGGHGSVAAAAASALAAEGSYHQPSTAALMGSTLQVATNGRQMPQLVVANADLGGTGDGPTLEQIIGMNND